MDGVAGGLDRAGEGLLVKGLDCPGRGGQCRGLGFLGFRARAGPTGPGHPRPAPRDADDDGGDRERRGRGIGVEGEAPEGERTRPPPADRVVDLGSGEQLLGRCGRPLEAPGARAHPHAGRLTPADESLALTDPGNPPGGGKVGDEVGHIVERVGAGHQAVAVHPAGGQAHARVPTMSCAAPRNRRWRRASGNPAVRSMASISAGSGR